MSKVAFLGNRSLDRVRHCFEQEGVEFARVSVRDQELVEAPVVSLTSVEVSGASVVGNVAGQGKSAAMRGYFERALEEAGGRPDLWVLDWSVMFSPCHTRISEATSATTSYELLLTEFVVHLQEEQTPLLFLSGDLKDLGQVRSSLASGLADYVRLSSSEAKEDADLDEDDSREVCERVQVLLDRFDGSGANTREQELTDTQRQLMTPVRSLVELHSPKSGRVDAARVATFYDLPQAALARALGVLRATLNKTPDAASLQEALQPWSYVAGALEELVGSREAALVWLNTPNPLLEDNTPLALMRGGEAEIVASVLRDALMGQPA